MEDPCGAPISQCTFSAIAQRLDANVVVFRARNLANTIEFLFMDRIFKMLREPEMER